MGDPHFKHRALLQAHKAEVFSANFTLYGDIAERVSSTLAGYAPNIEIYSIDEAFLQINNLSITDYNAWAKHVAQEVGRQVGIPVSVGVGPSKTLAKLAVERAKKIPELRGGYSVAADQKLKGYDHELLMEECLRWLPLEDIWGVGRRYAKKLHMRGLRTAYDVTRLTDEWVLTNMTIRGLKTVKELRGESNIPLDEFENDNQQKNLSVTRMFGQRVRSLAELEAAVATFAARAATRLRRKEQLAWRGSVFIRAQLPNRQHRYMSAGFQLAVPTSYTSDVIRGAHEALRKIYDPDFMYRKAGIILGSLVDEGDQQMSLFGREDQATRMKGQISLMKAMDDITLRYGKKSVTYGAELHRSDHWKSNQKQMTPAYTTRWSEIPQVTMG
jgi:DNA polymerase V